MPINSIVVRSLDSHADLLACVALQQATWGKQFRELVPPAMLLVVENMGGILAGAFDGGRLVGFVFGVTGLKDGRLAHWSHMLAVDERLRDRGIGRRLKQYQRDRLAAMGVDRMYWTYDPLVARNAHLNLNRLGARVFEYVRDMYGDDPASTMDAVIGTDRFVVEWDLAAPPPTSQDGQMDRRTDGQTDRGTDRPPIIDLESDELPEIDPLGVAIPADIHELTERRPDEARAWRAATRRAFEHYLPGGYRVTRLDTAPDTDRSYYVLERSAT